MSTQERQPQKGINPGNKGPAQPQDVDRPGRPADPHPSDEEDHARERLLEQEEGDRDSGPGPHR